MINVPKKIKIFLWEPSLGADRLQRRMSYMHLSPSWCYMCQHVEFPAHSSFASRLWHIILKGFRWHLLVLIIFLISSFLVVLRRRVGGRFFFFFFKEFVWWTQWPIFSDSFSSFWSFYGSSFVHYILLVQIMIRQLIVCIKIYANWETPNYLSNYFLT